MVNDAAKYALGLTGFGLVAAAVYRAANGDRAGALLLVAAAAAAAVVAIGAHQVSGVDVAPFVAADAEPAHQPLDADDVAPPSLAPALTAAGVTLLFAGGALGGEVAVEGIIVAAAGLALWLAAAWRRTPTFTERDAANLDDRLVGPIALPVAAFLVTAVIAVSFSRVLLAVSETASWVIALVVAAALLAILWVLAHRGVSRRVGAGLAILGAVAMLLAGGAGASVGPREFHHHSEEQLNLARVTARDIEFDEDTLELPANQDTEIVFLNFDRGVNHNVAVYTNDEPGIPVFNGAPTLGGTITYKFRAPQPGQYRFVCDFHPNMVGTLNVLKSANEPHESEQGELGH